MGMSIDEAIRHLDTYSSTMGSGQTTQEQHEDAKRVAVDTMRKYQKLEQEPNTKNDLGVDCIDRQATLDAIIKRLGIKNETYLLEAERTIYQQILAMPSVTPQEPRKGHWIKTSKAVMGEGYMWYCDKCEHQVYQDSSRPYPSETYCPNCGAKMIEPQESEDKE